MAPSQGAVWKLKPLPAKLIRALRRGKKPEKKKRERRIGSARSPRRSSASSMLVQYPGHARQSGRARQRHAHAEGDGAVDRQLGLAAHDVDDERAHAVAGRVPPLGPGQRELGRAVLPDDLARRRPGPPPA